MNIAEDSPRTHNPSSACAVPPRSTYERLLYTVFQRPERKKGQGMIVALTAVHSGAGVSWITAALTHELARYEFTSVAKINSKSLRRLCEPAVVDIQRRQTHTGGNRNVSDLNISEAELRTMEQSGASGRWEASRTYRRDCIQLLRAQFDYVLIDCPSMRDSGDLLGIAPFVDGVLLVVEANRTGRDQLQLAERTIESAHGKLLGHVLNKRTYQVPSWLYSRI